jgi:predicted ribosomally synthesized peptide with SipW-like signal peptide
MKKIVALCLALVVMLGIMGVETFAYFTDMETSSGNRLVAGTLDLKTNDADGVSQTLFAIDMAPGAIVSSSIITLRNAGTINGATLDIGFTYAESDGSPNSVNKTDDQVAAMIEVIALDYGGFSLLASIGDANGNGYKDVYDLKNSNLTGQSGIAASTTKNFDISVRLKSDTGSDFQADGIVMTMTFILRQ